jgi:outer membrane receptor protein involved in Fe transport
MKFLTNQIILIFVFVFLLSAAIYAQRTLRGEVTDSTNGEPLIGANILVKGTTVGTIADADGSFELTTDQPLPLMLVVSYTGYNSLEVTVSDAQQRIQAQLSENITVIEAVQVVGRRISERQQQSPLTMETLDNIGIRETPAANFYDGLGSLKDVDLTAASLGFKIINTRGFNSTSPVRSLQIIDGVDNQSPGLNFSLGNFLGSSELDVNRVNLIVGASSAFYGPNAFNGVISMETKNPFLHQGISAMVKGGERNLIETAARWAQAFTNKAGLQNVAYKLNFSFMRADDWEADNYDPVFDTPTDRSNPGGFDAVNIYGDEYLTSNDFSGSLANPGLGIIHRRGYNELDVVDYDSENLKLGGALHFRLNPSQNVQSPELILASNFSTGTTVYQGDNRYSLRDIRFFQHRIEINKLDNYFLRAYVTHEDAGNSYDPYFTSLLLQSRAKPNNQWRSDYINYWQVNVLPRLRGQEGYPDPINFLGMPEAFRTALNGFLQNAQVRDSLFGWHAEAQAAANRGNPIDGTVDFFEPGTERFQTAFDDITSRISFQEGGTRFFDQSALAHAHGEYKFNNIIQRGSITDFDLLIGANARLYIPNSQGSILLDTFGRNIDTYEYGVYGGGTLELNKTLKISASLRLDKNQNFDLLFSPAASLVYSPSPITTYRLSFSSAIRNPTLADQYLFYNVGRAILIGNLNGFQNLITVESLLDYLNTLDNKLLQRFDVAPIEPEKVRTVEAGYRTTLFEKLYLDATYYYSFYQDFIGFNLGVDATFETLTGFPVTAQVYRVAANATDRVTTQGFSIGTNYYFSKYYAFTGNYSWNKLNTASDDPIIPAFNTPEHKFNVGIAGRDIPLKLAGIRFNNFGFNVNYKWIQSFLFEGSPQFTGIIPQYDLLDGQINWRLNKLNTTVKIGASNMLNNRRFQTYGGPRVGRLAYFSLLYEFRPK